MTIESSEDVVTDGVAATDGAVDDVVAAGDPGASRVMVAETHVGADASGNADVDGQAEADIHPAGAAGPSGKPQPPAPAKPSPPKPDQPAPPKPVEGPLPIRMLHDRILVNIEDEGERRTGSGILIPATVTMGKRLSWARVVATGPSVRSIKLGDRVLFDPEQRLEVELNNRSFVLLRERDLHAVFDDTKDDKATGMYL